MSDDRDRDDLEPRPAIAAQEPIEGEALETLEYLEASANAALWRRFAVLRYDHVFRVVYRELVKEQLESIRETIGLRRKKLMPALEQMLDTQFSRIEREADDVEFVDQLTRERFDTWVEHELDRSLLGVKETRFLAYGFMRAWTGASHEKLNALHRKHAEELKENFDREPTPPTDTSIRKFKSKNVQRLPALKGLLTAGGALFVGRRLQAAVGVALAGAMAALLTLSPMVPVPPGPVKAGLRCSAHQRGCRSSAEVCADESDGMPLWCSCFDPQGRGEWTASATCEPGETATSPLEVACVPGEVCLTEGAMCGVNVLPSARGQARIGAARCKGLVWQAFGDIAAADCFPGAVCRERAQYCLSAHQSGIPLLCDTKSGRFVAKPR